MAEKYLVNVDLADHPYPIYIQRNSVKKWADLLTPLVKDRKCLIISDSNVYSIYADKIIDIFNEAGAILYASVFPAGEASKNLTRVAQLFHKTASVGLTRDSIIIAFGGGVTGDIAGFVAATWMRGIKFIQIPTTLLAMVDSSVGGKTGVDLPEGKNLVGAFWQPEKVLIDPDFLKTLPEKERIGALAEIIKYGIIYDHRLFAQLEQNIEKMKSFDLDFITDIITRSCQIKAEIVKNDERETRGIRDFLNFGHTVGHAIEKATDYARYNHGEAVAIGMCIATDLSVRLGFLDPNEALRIENLIEAVGLPTRAPGVCMETVENALRLDKKNTATGIRWVLLDGIGTVRLLKLPQMQELKDILCERLI